MKYLNIKIDNIQIDGELITPKMNTNAAMMRELGMGHIPEDRQRRGLVTEFTANENMILGHHKDSSYNNFFEMNKLAILNSCEKNMKSFDVRPHNPDLKTSLFSGGNQQKLVVAREISNDPKLLVVGQPTRGVDIGAIEFIHRQIIGMRDAGKAVLLVSVELDEILSLSDRILVMFEGQIVGESLSKNASEILMKMLHNRNKEWRFNYAVCTWHKNKVNYLIDVRNNDYNKDQRNSLINIPDFPSTSPKRNCHKRTRT